MLKPGGKMVYSTCSFSYEEDEEIVDFLLNNTDAELGHIPDSLYYYHNKNNDKGIHILPSLFPGEGHYIALISKPGVIVSKIKDSYYEKKEKFGDYLFTLSEPFNIKHLNVIRYGVKIGQIDKQEIRYDYHYARFIKEFEPSLEIDKEALEKYYRGEAINVNYPKGYVLIKYQGINVDIAKSDGRIIKNRLPKGLRKKFAL
jgi:NOL1/NOP2/fmu family ribosome biogenesis protein